MPKFDVHLFEVVRVKVHNVEAENAEDACVKARDGYDPEGLFIVHGDGDGGTEAEYADETNHYLAVPAGDSKSPDCGKNDQWFLNTKRGPVPVTLPQMQGMDDIILDIVLPRKLWDVPVTRTGYGCRTAEVTARTEKDAVSMALDEAGNHDYSENESEYEAPDGAYPQEKKS